MQNFCVCGFFSLRALLQIGTKVFLPLSKMPKIRKKKVFAKTRSPGNAPYVMPQRAHIPARCLWRGWPRVFCSCFFFFFVPSSSEGALGPMAVASRVMSATFLLFFQKKREVKTFIVCLFLRASLFQTAPRKSRIKNKKKDIAESVRYFEPFEKLWFHSLRQF